MWCRTGLDMNPEMMCPDTMHRFVKRANLQELRHVVRADPNLRDTRGRPILHCALYHGRLNVVECLLDMGADVNRRRSRSNYRTPPVRAAASGHARLVELLLMRGAHPELGAEGGTTALHAAAGNGHTDVVEVLVRHCVATIDSKDPWYGTALCAGSDAGAVGMVRALLAAGADPAIPRWGDYKRTPLRIAQMENHQGCVELLEVGTRVLRSLTHRRFAQSHVPCCAV